MFESKQEKNIQMRSCIRYLFLKKYSNQDILEELQEIFGKSSISMTMVNKWLKKFGEGEKNVLVEKKSGRKIKIGDVEKEAVEESLKKNRKLTTREISNQTSIKKSTVFNILKELGILK